MTDPKAAPGPASPDATAKAATPTYVDFLCFRLDPEFRRLMGRDATVVKEFVRYLEQPAGGIEVRPYLTMGFRADCDFFLWAIAKDLAAFQPFVAGLLRTFVGRYLELRHAWVAVTKPSVYSRSHQQHFELGPSTSKYVFIYPFTKTHAWYQLPMEQRRAMMAVHNEVGHQFPGVTINTCYEFGLGDHDFMLAFECDDPREFSDLVQRLRETEARVYTAVDAPLIPGVRTTPDELAAGLALA